MAKRVRPEAKLKQQAQKFLTKVPEEHVFWCCDGRIFRDMKELAEGLSSMSDETFAYHYNAKKKDFSNWVRDIITDAKLAGDLEMALSRAQAAECVAARLAFLTSKLA